MSVPADDRSLPPGITLRQLQIFAVTAEAGSITTAAQRLFLSQTAVSLALRQLEKELGVSLMVRRRAHGITLTSTGRSLLPLGHSILSSVADFSREARSGDQVTGTVRVGCFPSLGPTLIPDLIESFSAAYPEARLDFVDGGQDSLVEMLELGTLDLAFMYNPGPHSGLDLVELQRLDYGILLDSHRDDGEAAGKELLHRLDSEPFVLLDDPVAEADARRLFNTVGIAPEIRYRTKNFETVRSLVGRGLGWAITLQRSAAGRTHEGRDVVFREIEDERIPRSSMVLLRNPQLVLSQASRALLNVVSERYPDAVLDRLTGTRAGPPSP